MTQIDYIIQKVIPTDDFASFRQTMVNIAVNAPEVFADVLGYVYFFQTLRRSTLKPGTVFRGRQDTMPTPDSIRINRDIAYNSEELEQFVKDCCTIRTKADSGAESARIDEMLHRLYDGNTVKAFHYLLTRAEEKHVREFVNSFLAPERLAQLASINLLVRPIADASKVRGNRGHYLIYIAKEGYTETVLKFVNQASCVYYLMYLIDRCHHDGNALPHIKLRQNTEPFAELYHKVYDTTPDALQARIQSLLYREDAAGLTRVGRERECISDIRKQLRTVFYYYDESYFPYAMTAGCHLTISPDRIIFEDEAESLLNFNFV